MPVKLKFCGGVRTVTGSNHLLITDKSRILIDSGIFYGHREEFYSVNSSFSYKVHKLDAVIISHAHIDHCGNVPSLIKRGLRCRIFSTSATRSLCRLMLADSGKIQEEDIHYLNKVNRKLGLPLRQALYTKKEGGRSVKKFRGIAYGQRFKIAKDVVLTFVNAGHILGSAVVVLDIVQKNKKLRLGYAVDLGRSGLPILDGPVAPDGLDYLVMETTYGGRFHPSSIDAKKQFKEIINRTIARNGKVIIPSFALERAQEVIYLLNELLKEKAIPSVPVYVDSPLAIDITEVFKDNLAFLDEKTRTLIRTKQSPFEFLNLKYTRSRRESKVLNEDKRPMIIIAGSGMCEAGRILHHLKNNIEDSRNTVLIVGYTARDTLGDRIRRKEKFVKIFGIEHQLNAEVEVVAGFSVHADSNGLLDYVKNYPKLKQVFLVHGDEDQSQAFYKRLIDEKIPTYMPVKDEELILD
ncbi:MAG: MBL fold metallo-hydrolase [Candidatus Gygaella obscura]|nr:MBL fold metallo-hydrolase [Candidatus Gygaella obscura]